MENFSFGIFIIFHSLTNLVPANVQKFKMSLETTGRPAMVIYFEKKGPKQWKLHNGKNNEDNILLTQKPGEQLHVDIATESEFTLSLKKFLVKRSHQDWRKVNYYDIKEEGKHSMRLNVSRLPNNVIRLQSTNEDSEKTYFESIRISWD